MLNINEIYKLSAAHKGLNIGDTVLVKSLDTSRQIIKCGEIKGVYDWGTIFSVMPQSLLIQKIRSIE